MQDEKSLLQKVYTARYFPIADFFEAKIRSNPSYAWREIWEKKKSFLATAISRLETVLQYIHGEILGFLGLKQRLRYHIYIGMI